MKSNLCWAWICALIVCGAARLVAAEVAEGQKLAGPAASAIGAGQSAVEGQRVFVCGHSFHVYIAAPLEKLATAAGIAHHVNAGVQFIGGSSVTQHWDLPDDQNKAKQALNGGNIDVLTLSPNWVMPDPAIDKFVDLALQKNPKTRIVVQLSWPAFDASKISEAIKTNEERDEKTVEQLTHAGEEWVGLVETQVRGINERLGKQAVYIAPVGKAVLALRTKVIAGEAPGVTRQSELFMDPLGHGKEPIQVLATYCYFATIYKLTPVGLTVFDKPGNEKWNQLNRLLQQLAWDAVRKYPLSGVAQN